MNKSEYSFILTWAKRIKAIRLLGGKCTKCSNDNIFVLSFHHPNKDKEKSMTRLKHYRWSEIEKEIRKCVLLCSNCHTEVHCNGSQNHKIKARLLEKIGKKCCSICGYSGKNYASLVFHHNNSSDKRFDISRYTTRQKSTKDITKEEFATEIDKCTLICQNCHRKKHMRNERFMRFKKDIYDKVDHYIENNKPIDESLLILLLKDGKRPVDICKILNLSKSTVSTCFKRMREDGKLNGLEKNNVKLISTERGCVFCHKKFYSTKRQKKFCSKKCSGSFRGVKNKPSYDEIIEMRKTMTLQQIGDKFGVSRVAVFHWLKKLI